MSFKLSKEEMRQYQENIDSLRTTTEAFEQAKKNKEDPLPALVEFLSTLETAREFCEMIAEDWRCEFEDRSDSWKENDRGSEVDSIIEEWESVELDEPDLDDPLNLELEDYAQLLEDLPTEL